MNRTALRHSLEIATNVCVLLLCLVSMVMLLRASRHTNEQSARSVSPQRGDLLQRGDILPRPEELRLDGKRDTLILVLNTTCRFCAESLPFYRQLIAANRNGAGLAVVAVFPNGQAEIKDFVKQIDSSLTTVAGEDYRDLRVVGTPTLVLVDPGARVQKVWTGKLSSQEEQEVLDIARGKAS